MPRLLNKSSRTVENVSIGVSNRHAKKEEAPVMEGAPWAVQRFALDEGRTVRRDWSYSHQPMSMDPGVNQLQSSMRAYY